MDVMDIELTAQQQNAVDDDSALVLILGGPGTGRTTLCLHKAVSFVEAGHRLDEVLILARSRATAQALRTRLLLQLDGAHLRPQVMTVHGFARSLVMPNAMMPQARESSEGDSAAAHLLTAPEQESLLREVIDAADRSEWPAQFQAACHDTKFISDVRFMAATISQAGVRGAELAAQGRRLQRDDWRVTGEILCEYERRLAESGDFDYTGLIHRAIDVLGSPTRRAEVREWIKLVICDDVTEVDHCQTVLLGQLSGAGIPLFLTADPDQTIGTFRGAQSGRIDGLLDEFTGHGRQPAIHHLTTDMRCCGDVHELVERVRSQLPVQPTVDLRQMPSERWSGGSGTCEYLEESSKARLARSIARRLRRAHLYEGIAWEQMAVLARNGSDVDVLATLLAAEDVPAYRSSQDVVLSEVPAVRELIVGLQAAIDLAEGCDDDHQRRMVDRLLDSPLSATTHEQVHRFRAWLAVHGGSVNWAELTSLLRSKKAADVDVPGAPGNLPKAPHEPQRVDDDSDTIASGEDASTSQTSDTTDSRDSEVPVLPAELRRELSGVSALIRRIDMAAVNLRKNGPVDVSLWRVWGGESAPNSTLQTWPDVLKQRALDADATANRELDGLCALFDMAGRHGEHIGTHGARQFIAEALSEQTPADRSRETDRDRNGVCIMTAHRAKETQFDLVALYGLEEQSWPAMNLTGSMTGADVWSPEEPLPPRDWSETLQSERRLFLTACSRARHVVVLTAVRNDEEGVIPSRFLTSVRDLCHEEDSCEQSRISAVPRHENLADLIADLRRSAVDEQLPVTLRRHAARQLAWLAAQKKGDRPLAAHADPDTWWGPGIDPVRQNGESTGKPDVYLSPSHVGELLDCPRRWFLSHRLGASGTMSAKAQAGSLVHRIAEENAEHWSLDRAMDQLDAEWATISFDYEWESRAVLENCREGLRRLDGWLMQSSHRELVGTEVPVTHVFDLPSAVVHISGSIDRLERDNAGNHIVIDYKTGTKLPGKMNPHVIQVAIYQAALAEGDENRRPVDVGPAELVYLMDEPHKRGKGATVKPVSPVEADPWPSGGDFTAVAGFHDWIRHDLDRAARVVLGAQRVAVENQGCRFCPVRSGCPALVPPDPAVDVPRKSVSPAKSGSQERKSR